jgi:hypothetical protein
LSPVGGTNKKKKRKCQSTRWRKVLSKLTGGWTSFILLRRGRQLDTFLNFGGARKLSGILRKKRGGRARDMLKHHLPHL